MLTIVRSFYMIMQLNVSAIVAKYCCKFKHFVTRKRRSHSVVRRGHSHSVYVQQTLRVACAVMRDFKSYWGRRCIRLIVGFQPLMVISPTASWIRWCMHVYAW